MPALPAKRTWLRWRHAGLQAISRRAARHGAADASGRRRLAKMPLMSAMAARLKRAGRQSRYRLRKQVVEPV